VAVAGAGLALLAAVIAAVVIASAGGADDGEATVVDARDYIERELAGTIALTLYENPASREHLEDQARTREPDVWEQANADGEVTFDEFRTFREVRNASNHYSGDFLTDFQNAMVAITEG
jgi:hypothetical protein